MHVLEGRRLVFVLGRPNQAFARLAPLVLAAAVLLPATPRVAGTRLAAASGIVLAAAVCVETPRPVGLEPVSLLRVSTSATAGRVDGCHNRLLRLELLRVLVRDSCEPKKQGRIMTPV